LFAGTALKCRGPFFRRQCFSRTLRGIIHGIDSTAVACIVGIIIGTLARLAGYVGNGDFLRRRQWQANHPHA
jgi:hypothetical protein